MRTIPTSIQLTTMGVAVATLFASGMACYPDGPPNQSPSSGTSTVAIKDTPFLPPAYTEQQCASVVASFPGWDKVAPVPETDTNGRPTLWYAVVPITARAQLDDLTAVGIAVEPAPIFTNDATDSSLAGQTGVLSKSTCAGAQIVWAIVPGPVFNAIRQSPPQLGRGFNAIILQPVPDVFADVSIAYQSIHPISYQALHDAGFAYMGVNAPPPSAASSAVAM
jgi:hypothetical protein